MDNFNLDYPECVKEMGLNGVPPTATKHRYRLRRSVSSRLSRRLHHFHSNTPWLYSYGDLSGFFVTGADVVPSETFGPKADEMREQFKIARELMIFTRNDGYSICRSVSSRFRYNDYLPSWFS